MQVFDKDRSKKNRRKAILSLLSILCVTIYAVNASSDTTYYASPVGTGNGLSVSNPFQIGDFWSVAQPGDTLFLLDGKYTGSRSMINPPQRLSGTEGNPITIKALNDGKVEIDGEDTYIPVNLWWENSWFMIEGFNAHNSNESVVSISHGSSHNIVRRIAAWDARDGNCYIFSLDSPGDLHIVTEYNLLEDCAGWGIAREDGTGHIIRDLKVLLLFVIIIAI